VYSRDTGRGNSREGGGHLLLVPLHGRESAEALQPRGGTVAASRAVGATSCLREAAA